MSDRDPIILVGMQRSGTTWMGRLLSARPEIAYWIEPRQVWSWGNWFKPDDRLTADDASPRVAAHIRRSFAEFTRERGRTRFAEKTPSNCVRIPFVRAVLPEAKILLVVRDGRSVIRSSAQMSRTGPGWRRIGQRLREARISDWPAYLSRASWLVDKLRRRPVAMWGVQPPGWRAWVGQDAPLVVMAKQWATAIRYALTDGRAGDPAGYLEVRYEDLTSSPRPTMQRIVDFLELAGAGDLVREVETQADAGRQDKWRQELGAGALELVRPHLEPTLRWLGYEW